MRWQAFLSRFDFEWEYRKGVYNIADPLSRNPALLNMQMCKDGFGQTSQALRDSIKLSYAQDPWFHDLSNVEHLQYQDGLFFKGAQVLVPQDGDLRRRCIAMHHDPPYIGHLGRDRTLEQVRRHFLWPGMRQDVAEYVAKCDLCQRNKAANQSPLGLLVPLQIPEGLWESISMDLITHLPETKDKNSAIVVFVDRLSKMVRLVPVKMAIDAKEYANLFVRETFAKHGLPKSIVFDRDPRFTSDFFRQLCKCLKVDQNLSTAFHPQTDGQTERMNRVLEEMLRAFVGSAFDSWDKHLPCCEFAINNAFQESIRTTPFFLNYGRHPRSPTNSAFLPTELVGSNFVTGMHEALEDAKRFLRIAQERQARYANKRRTDLSFRVGDYVLLDGKNLRLKVDGARKLMHRFWGPFKILKRIGPVAYELELPRNMLMHDVFHVSLLRLYKRREEDGEGAPPAFLPDGFVEHEVEEVLTHQDDADNERWYRVRWGGKDETWEPEAHMANCRDKIREYFAKIGMPNERQPRLSKRPRPKKQSQPELQTAEPNLPVAKKVGRPRKLKEVISQVPEAVRRSSRFKEAVLAFIAARSSNQ